MLIILIKTKIKRNCSSKETPHHAQPHSIIHTHTANKSSFLLFTRNIPFMSI